MRSSDFTLHIYERLSGSFLAENSLIKTDEHALSW